MTPARATEMIDIHGASAPRDALEILAADLRQEGPLVAEHVSGPAVQPVLGLLVAAGPRCAADPRGYAEVIEAVREGYLLHYGEPRLLASLDPDLRLLLGDHLYARGIERLAQLGDLAAVGELADLISISAQLYAAPAESAGARDVAWLAACVAIAVGPDDSHGAAKRDLRARGDAEALWNVAWSSAERAGLSEPLAAASEAVGFRPSDLG